MQKCGDLPKKDNKKNVYYDTILTLDIEVSSYFDYDTHYATFDFSKDSVGKNFDGRRITPRNLSGINNPIYERKVDMEKIIDLYQTGQVEKVNRINKGINAENIRVNSLYLLCRELKMLEEKFSNPETAEEYKNQ